MPTLDIEDWEKLNKTEKMIAYSKVRAAMLFPEDAQLRKDYLVTYATGEMINLIQSGELKKHKLHDWIGEYLDKVGGLEGLLYSRGFEEMHEKINQSYKEGVVAGWMFTSLHTLSKRNFGKDSLNASKGIVAFLISELPNNMGKIIKRFSAENFWDKKKSVIHLWAAFTAYKNTFKNDTEALNTMGFHEIIPFGNINTFFGFAKFYQTFGLNFYPPRTRIPILNKEEIYTLSKEWDSPDLNIEWEENEQLINELISLTDKEFTSEIPPAYKRN